MAPHDSNMASWFKYSGSASQIDRRHTWRYALLLSGITLTTVLCGLGTPAIATDKAATDKAATDKAAADTLPASLHTLATTPGNIIPPLGQAEPFLPETTAAPTVDQASTVRLILKRGKRRVYVYQGEKEISSYPVAIGKPGWETPLGKFEVLNMEENPIFKSFKSGRIIPPGEDNPLGVRWVGIWTDGKTQLGFHGTNEPELIGQAVSHGCIRMHNKDVTKLYQQVKMGTSVTIVP
jgi:lipoprotein-anchoring transpeptidase ErfK/SrfK